MSSASPAASSDGHTAARSQFAVHGRGWRPRYPISAAAEAPRLRTVVAIKDCIDNDARLHLQRVCSGSSLLDCMLISLQPEPIGSGSSGNRSTEACGANKAIYDIPNYKN